MKVKTHYISLNLKKSDTKIGQTKISKIYIDTKSYQPIIETDAVYKQSTGGIKKWFDTSDYGERRRNRPLPVGSTNKKVIEFNER